MFTIAVVPLTGADGGDPVRDRHEQRPGCGEDRNRSQSGYERQRTHLNHSRGAPCFEGG